MVSNIDTPTTTKQKFKFKLDENTMSFSYIRFLSLRKKKFFCNSKTISKHELHLLLLLLLRLFFFFLISFQTDKMDLVALPLKRFKWINICKPFLLLLLLIYGIVYAAFVYDRHTNHTNLFYFNFYFSFKKHSFRYAISLELFKLYASLNFVP